MSMAPPNGSLTAAGRIPSGREPSASGYFMNEATLMGKVG
jgi:hypothetical protein